LDKFYTDKMRILTSSISFFMVRYKSIYLL